MRTIIDTAKVYSASPLPFQGQKRHFLRKFKTLLDKYPEDITIVDLFGGSGLLSHTAKRTKPQAKVIYNDYDGFTGRLANIPKTNVLLPKIRQFTADIPKKKALPGSVKNKILHLIKEEEVSTGYVDYITLSSSLLFSSKYATDYESLAKEKFYSNVRKNGYDATGYLDGIEVVYEDYRKLYERYKDTPNVLFLIDPPYLSTDVNTYKIFWKLKDYTSILTILNGHYFVYFTSDKSGIVELCEWLGSLPGFEETLGNIAKMEVGRTLNHTSSYTDIILYSLPPPAKNLKTINPRLS